MRRSIPLPGHVSEYRSYRGETRGGGRHEAPDRMQITITDLPVLGGYSWLIGGCRALPGSRSGIALKLWLLQSNPTYLWAYAGGTVVHRDALRHQVIV